MFPPPVRATLAATPRQAHTVEGMSMWAARPATMSVTTPVFATTSLAEPATCSQWQQQQWIFHTKHPRVAIQPPLLPVSSKAILRVLTCVSSQGSQHLHRQLKGLGVVHKGVCRRGDGGNTRRCANQGRALSCTTTSATTTPSPTAHIVSTTGQVPGYRRQESNRLTPPSHYPPMQSHLWHTCAVAALGPPPAGSWVHPHP